MKVRLGYACLSKAMNNITTSSTITYTNYINKNYTVNKLLDVTKSNLDALKELLIYNVKNNIHFYRLTSKLVPLATHNKVSFDYIKPLADKYKEIGNIISENDMRVDTHPDQYAVLNSVDKKIIKNTFEILQYHYKVLKALEIKNPVIILHVGSSVCGKKASITRFINNFNKLPEHIQKCIAVENDDKIYNIKDVLDLCTKLNIPMVLDYHHYICNNEGEKLEDYIAKNKVRASTAKMAKSREKKLEKIEVIEKPSFTSKPHFSFKGIETTAQVILEIKNLEVRILLLITSTNEI